MGYLVRSSLVRIENINSFKDFILVFPKLVYHLIMIGKMWVYAALKGYFFRANYAKRAY
jgi:hypothetical protein